MIVYVDQTFINDYLMSLAIIWAVANFMEIKYKWFKLLLAAFAGSVYLFLVIVLQTLSINYLITIIIHVLLNIFAAVLIIKIAFPGLNRRGFFRAFAYLYLITFITIGAILSLFFIYGGTPFDIEILKIIILGIVLLFLIGNFGWRIFQRYKTPEEFYLPVRIYYQERMVNIIGLVDTGNSLTDPLTNAPVIVINLEEVLALFPEEIHKDLLLCGKDSIKAIDLLNSHGLGQRIRILPFSDLGQENGIIPGFRPDSVELEYQGSILDTDKCVIALSGRRLDIDNEYQALIHPRLLKSDFLLQRP